jgi:hypothetical protein
VNCFSPGNRPNGFPDFPCSEEFKRLVTVRRLGAAAVMLRATVAALIGASFSDRRSLAWVAYEDINGVLIRARCTSRAGAGVYSITSSARCKNDSGIVSPSAFAVLRFRMSIYLSGAEPLGQRALCL